MDRQFIILFVIGAYMLAMIIVGLYYSRTNNTVSDYVLGGRSLNSWVTALSAQASDMSGWLLTGLPGLAYLSMAGFKEAFWTATGLAIGTLLNWLFVAKRLRSFTEIFGDSLTLPDYFRNRFRDTGKTLKIVTALAISIFFLVYTSSMFVTGAKMFNSIFGMEYTIGLLVTSFVIIVYTFFGGFRAVCVTDSIQGMLMFFALVFIPFAVIHACGGTTATFANIDPANFNFFPNGDGSVTTLLIVSALAWGLGYFGQPHIIVRFMAINKPSDVNKSTIVAMIWVIITLTAAVMGGLFGTAYFANDPLAAGTHETVLIVMANKMFSPALTGVFLSAVLAAVMSTAASQLLVTSSALASDIYKTVFRQHAGEGEILLVNKLSVLAVSAIAIYLSFDPNSSIFGIVSNAWAGLGASFGPVVVLSLYWKHITKNGAIAGVITGAVGTIVFHSLKQLGGIFAVYELLPAFILSLIMIVVVSKLGKPNDASIERDFDRAVEFSKTK